VKSLKEIEMRSYLSLEDLVKLEDFIHSTGYMSPEKARKEVEWFTVELGIDEYYFKTTGIDDIARHLVAISASELIASYGGEGMGIQIINERPDRAVYIVEDDSGKTEEIEKRIEKKYSMFRLESYRTKKSTRDKFLRLYIVTKPVFNKKKPNTFEDNINKAFLDQSAPDTVERYKKAWESMEHSESPYISTTDKMETGETRVMVGIHSESARQFLNYFSHLINNYNIFSNRKYREPFRDGKRVYTFYFNKIDDETVMKFSRNLNAVVMLPENPISKLFLDEIYSSMETMYAISAASFTHQFLTVLTQEYLTLNRALKDQPEAKGILDTLKMRLTKDTFSEARIAQAVVEHHDIVTLIYSHFESKMHHRQADKNLKELEKNIIAKIEADVPSLKDRMILNHFIVFNNTILKTNFFMRDKTCMAYRLDPGFLNKVDFPEEPFGVFFFVGREFIGFHVRFRDIARGGIRIVRSRDLTGYEHNLDTIFLENYNLALTQQAKNKDIPEGGSKGTILLNLDNQSEAIEAFKSYIDGMMDVIMPNEEILDLYRKEEILFLGPDEGTAELMNWAALYARRRMYSFWNAFTTGKDPSIGGIPHDAHGMTTVGIHEYILCVMEKLGLKEEEITKMQTGGPDGDLGSNEILQSNDKTVAIVDGSGVLYDPEGINRKEIARLAHRRLMVSEFDKSFISKNGFFVSINDKEITLPDGSIAHNGEEFRNKFHLNPLAKADLFVPCGGRPAAVNIRNWHYLLDEKGAPRFRIIIEGANLFITEEARLRLEENGVILIKDASTNKGGVTSSSFEVFASLALSDREYEDHMRVKKEIVPDFRKAYINEVISIIRKNARLEFDLLWNEHEKKGIPFTKLTNLLSRKINDLTDAVFVSNLNKNTDFVEKIVTEYSPKTLKDFIGVDNIIKRVPENYLFSIVATRIATDFVYTKGLNTNEVDFYDYLGRHIC
jgi:glutamate dehydrogenase